MPENLLSDPVQKRESFNFLAFLLTFLAIVLRHKVGSKKTTLTFSNNDQIKRIK